MVLDWGSWDEPRRRKSIPKAVKNSVWAKYIGANKAEGACYVCKRTIHITDFDVGHNKARSKGGSDNISNLRPICRTCNTSMGTQSIESFKAKHFSKPKTSTSKNTTSKQKTTKKSAHKKKRRSRDDLWDW